MLQDTGVAVCGMSTEQGCRRVVVVMSLLCFQAADTGSFGLPGFLTAVVLLGMFLQLPGNAQAEAQGEGITLSGSACAAWTSHCGVCPLVFWGFGL